MSSAPAVRWADPGDLDAVAERVAGEVSRRGPKRIAIAGGSTPRKVLAALTERGVDWTGTSVVPTDDRQVPPDHPASNLGMLRAALAGTAAEVLPLVEGERQAAFDLVWLGMGEDGHVASLFPHMVAELRPGPCVIATQPIPLPPEAPFPRLSLNRAALAQAGEIILAVTGQAKRRVIEQALAGGDALPVSDVLRGPGPPVTIYWSP